MGCSSGKAGGNPNEIQFEMKETKVADFDSFFKSASEFLEGLEELRATFQDTREEMHELGRTEELTNPALIEAIKVFLWSVSAHKDGNIKAANANYTIDPPGFSIDCTGMDIKTYDFGDAMNELIGGMLGAPQKIADLGGKCKEVGEKANDLKTELKAKVDESGLDPMAKLKAVANATVNFATVLKGIAKAPGVFKQATEALTDMKSILPSIKTLMDEADHIGKEASGKGMRKMDELFDHYQKSTKKAADVVAAEKKKKKPKKHGRKKNKKGGAHGGAAGGAHGGEHKAEGHGH